MLATDDILTWFPGITRPLVIAGPCSAETEEQVLLTALGIKDDPRVTAFRCGLWKPRTHPGDFQGVGSAGLPWLAKVKEQTGLRIAVEVATPAHVEACLRAGVDILWIGARTVVNPFSIQEITAALQGTDIPVMVKNPVNPDLELWIGSLERLSNSGLKKLAAVHRGFSSYGSKPYRNIPVWEIPIEFKRRFPGYPLLCDPSHISGKASHVEEISRMAMELNYDGLMVEVHHDPPSSLTDKEQQLRPGELGRMLDNVLTSRSPGDKEIAGDIIIEELRLNVDIIDQRMLDLIRERMMWVEKIGMIKRSKNLPALQMERWKAIRKDRLRLAEEMGLHPPFISKMLELIHKESIRIQVEAYKKEKDS